MNKTTALTIGVIIGFIVLAVIGVAVFAFFPYEQVFAPTPTITSTPTVTPTPTFPVFLPTASSNTPTKPPPSPTNTRVPTTTPAPTRTPIPTEAIVVPTIVVVPTSTPTEDTTAVEAPGPAPASAPRHYTLTFEADKTVVEKGRCTTVRWQSSGPISLWYEGQAVESSGEERVCPRVTTTYILDYQVAGGSGIQSERVTVKVE